MFGLFDSNEVDLFWPAAKFLRTAYFGISGLLGGAVGILNSGYLAEC
ncbi:MULTISPECIES: hypothetical protein [Methylosinus]|nr:MULTISPECIES: hypothetical protein [Methylosinus]